jgi:hypothetical protein
MNLEKYTKAELISKIKKSEIKKSENTSNHKNNTQPLTLWDILNKIKILLLSLSIITVLTRLFKNYRSIRAILRVANYVILALFGVSFLEAFGLGFIAKFLGEVKFILLNIVTYLTDSTFYLYLSKMFKVTEENQSIRNIYKKPVEPDWKAEYEKVEKRREWENWLEKHGHHQKTENEGINKNIIILTILFLGGSIAIWYYGKDALDILSPVWSLGTLINRILRGGDGDDTPPATPMPVESIHESKLVYSSENRPLDPPVTNHGEPEVVKEERTKRAGLFDSIKDGKKLSNAKDRVIPKEIPKIKNKKTGSFKWNLPSEEENADGGVSKVTLDNKATTSKITLENEEPTVLDQVKLVKKLRHVETREKTPIEASFKEPTEPDSLITSLSKKFDALAKFAIEDDNTPESDWESNSTTPTKVISIEADTIAVESHETIEKSSNIIENKSDISSNSSESPRSDKAELGIVTDLGTTSKKGKNKFLDAIAMGNIPSSPSNISPILDPVREKFPNLSKETLEKLSTVDGFKNRDKIIASLSEDELKVSSPSFEKPIIDKKLLIENKEEKIDRLIKENLDLDSETVIEKIKEINPDYNETVYRENFMKAMESEINAGKTEEERNKIRQSFLNYDLNELQTIMKNPDSRSIKNVVNENYTHNNLMKEIKHKSSLIIQQNRESSTQHLENTMDLFD